MTITNTATITGGNGGAGGAGSAAAPVGTSGNGTAIPAGANGAPGIGGVGVLGAGLIVDNTNGMISGGRANGGNLDQVQAYALQFTGATNYASYTGIYAGGVNVMAGATFQPALNGSAVGTTMNVGGPAVFTSSSIYQVRISPTLSDSVTATTATLAGAKVNAVAGAGAFTAGTMYTILTATNGGLGGANVFGAATTNLAFFAATLSYTANTVTLTLVPIGGGSVNYSSAAVTQNQRAVASGLTNASNGNGNSGPLLGALNQLTVAQAQAAFDSLSGEGIPAAQNLAHREAELFTSAIFDQTTFYGSDRGGANQIVLTAPTPGAGGPGSGFVALAQSGTGADADRLKVQPIRELADLPSSRPAFIAPLPVAPTRTWRAWGTGFGGDDEIHSNAAIGFAAQSNQIYGGAVGVDYQITPNYLAGIAVGGSDGEFSVPNRSTSGSTTGGHIAFYDLAEFGPYYGASSTSASFYQNRTTRNVAGFGGLATETERGNFFSDEFRSRLEFGRHFANLFGTGSATIVTPFIALELAELRTNGFGEQTIAGGPAGFAGGPGLFALNVSGQSTADVPSFVGARFQSVMTLGNGMRFSPSLQLAYEHEFAPNRQLFAGINSLPGAVFLVDGARPARDAAQVKAGGELAIGPRTAIFANFDGEFSGVNQFYAGKGGVKVLF